MNAAAIIAAVPTRNRTRLIEKDQDVADIIRLITYAHKRNADQYDQFAWKFWTGDVKSTARNLWKQCRDLIEYKIETEEIQTVRSPGRILQAGIGDCKHYASFIAGVLDSLKRQGLPITWYYRFAEYRNWMGEITNHVFVVVRQPGDKEIWIDPVLDSFNFRAPYYRAWDKRIDTTSSKTVGCTCNATMGADDSSEATLLADLKSYVDGLPTSVANLQTNGTIDQSIDAILKAATASAVPGAAQAFAIAGAVQQGVTKVFGSGSVLTRIVNADLSSNVLFAPVAIIKTIFNGRTFNSDQYLGTMDYNYYVLSTNLGNSNNVTDAQVLPAMLWFETKLGIFISGRAHLDALRGGVDNYIAFIKYNGDTTQDRVRVQLAYNVMASYMPSNQVLGAWAGTVGVYDNAVTAAIMKDRLSNPAAATDTSGTVPVSASTTSLINTAALTGGLSTGTILLIAALGIAVLSSSKKRA